MGIFLISHDGMILIQLSLGTGVRGAGSSWVGDSSSFLVHATKKKVGFSLHGDTMLKGEKINAFCVSSSSLLENILTKPLGVWMWYFFSISSCVFSSHLRVH